MITMGKLLLFESPETAETLRDSGLSVFLQDINGKKYYAVMDSPDVRGVLGKSCEIFSKPQLVMSTRAYF